MSQTQEWYPIREERYRQIVDVANEGIWQLDIYGKTTFTNASLTGILGYSECELANMQMWDLIDRDCIDQFSEAWSAVFKSDLRQLDCSMKSKTGRKIWVYLSISPIKDRAGQIHGVLALVTDVTRRHEIEDELKNAKAIAEAASEAKTQFLANMSHEIRTPLTAVLGFSELLLDPELAVAERTEAVDAINRNGRLLLNLINDILDLSKVEAGRLKVEAMPFSVGELFEEISMNFRPLAEAKGIQFLVNICKQVPEMICSDPTRVRQILLNIIGNAFKFTEKGKVEVSTLMSGKELIIEVSDTGPGINHCNLQRLFEPFSQADASITRRFGGTGLGLVLSRNIARSLAGDIRLVSAELGKGATFEIRLPIDLPTSAEFKKVGTKLQPNVSGATARQQLRGKRILVVDDSADNRLLIAKLLEPYEIEIQTAENGRIGVDLALDGAHDLILMDIQMPEMDGYEATKILRSRGYQKPIVALTAHAMKEEREHSIEVGCTAHLAKPLNKQQLVSTLCNFIHPL